MQSIQLFRQSWHDASINFKFIVGISIIVALIFVLALTTFFSTYFVVNQTENRILLAADIQRLTLDTDRHFQQALVLQRDFFGRYNDEGLTQAQTNYTLPAIKRLEDVQMLVEELEGNLNAFEADSMSNSLDAYRTTADTNKSLFIEAASFISILINPETGLEGQLENTAEELANKLEDYPRLATQLNDLRLLEREYFILRKPTSMELVYTKIEQLKNDTESSSTLEPAIRNEVLPLLDIHLAIAEEIVAIDAKILEISQQFDLASQPINETSAVLISFAEQETANAHADLQQISRILIGATIIISSGVFIVSLLTFRTLRRNIIPRIINLTSVALRYQEGDFDKRNTVENNDEIGKLGNAFNLMASEISRLLSDLETQNKIISNVNSELSSELLAKEKIQHSLEENQSRLKRYAADLERSNEELEEFAYIVSHDLRAPLRGIASLSSWLELDYAESLDENGIEMLELLNSRVKRLETLIEGILEFSRVGRQETRRGEIDIQEMLNEILDTLAPPENFSFDIQSDLPTIEGEPIRIAQVFQNLIDNAIKYSDKVEGLIEIQFEDKGDEWLFSVKDNGRGIDERYNKKIFQIFQTLSMDENEIAQSSGVGLSLVRKIIQLHGGDIWVDSELGEWTRFSFVLPKVIPSSNKPILEMEIETPILEAI